MEAVLALVSALIVFIIGFIASTAIYGYNADQTKPFITALILAAFAAILVFLLRRNKKSLNKTASKSLATALIIVLLLLVVGIILSFQFVSNIPQSGIKLL